MTVPGMTACGLVSHGSRWAASQTKPALANPGEYWNPGWLPALRPTTPYRFGPCRFAAPWALAWQVPHWRPNSVAPSAEAALSGRLICAQAGPDRVARTARRMAGTR